MTILDIDLDAFVQPPVSNRKKGDPRPPDADHTLFPNDDVTRLLREKWNVQQATPLALLNDHDEILAPIETLIDQGVLRPPFIWVHIDAHDDFYGHYSRPTTCANFMYAVIRRGWASRILWLYPPENAGGPPDYIYDGNRFEIFFEEFRVPFRVAPLDGPKLRLKPAHAFLCRSPEFSPAKSDALYDHIASHFTVIVP